MAMRMGNGHPQASSRTRRRRQRHAFACREVFAFSVMKNLVSDPNATDNLAQLFRRLFDLLDRGLISYLQGTLQVQLPSAQAQEIAELAKSMGIAITIRDR